MWGISYPGFYALAALIDAHPALKAVSPQAPVTDYYLNDDSYHNGAFLLAHNFSFYVDFPPRGPAAAASAARHRVQATARRTATASTWTAAR